MEIIRVTKMFESLVSSTMCFLFDVGVVSAGAVQLVSNLHVLSYYKLVPVRTCLSCREAAFLSACKV